MCIRRVLCSVVLLSCCRRVLCCHVVLRYQLRGGFPLFCRRRALCRFGCLLYCVLLLWVLLVVVVVVFVSVRCFRYCVGRVFVFIGILGRSRLCFCRCRRLRLVGLVCRGWL